MQYFETRESQIGELTFKAEICLGEFDRQTQYMIIHWLGLYQKEKFEPEWLYHKFHTDEEGVRNLWRKILSKSDEILIKIAYECVQEFGPALGKIIRHMFGLGVQKMDIVQLKTKFKLDDEQIHLLKSRFIKALQQYRVDIFKEFARLEVQEPIALDQFKTPEQMDEFRQLLDLSEYEVETMSEKQLKEILAKVQTINLNIFSSSERKELREKYLKFIEILQARLSGIHSEKIKAGIQARKDKQEEE